MWWKEGPGWVTNPDFPEELGKEGIWNSSQLGFVSHPRSGYKKLSEHVDKKGTDIGLKEWVVQEWVVQCAREKSSNMK